MSRSIHDGIEQGCSDEVLMARYADGDTAAFEALFLRYEPRVYAFFLKRTASRERSQDLYQELFLRIHGARDRYDPAQPFASWMFKIANRLLVDDYRRAFRNREVPLADREIRSARRRSDDVVADRDHAARLLDALSHEERQVVLSSKVEGVGYAELAKQLGKSVDAVKKIASRAILRLRASGFAEGTAHRIAR